MLRWNFRGVQFVSALTTFISSLPVCLPPPGLLSPCLASLSSPPLLRPVLPVPRSSAGSPLHSRHTHRTQMQTHRDAHQNNCDGSWGFSLGRISKDTTMTGLNLTWRLKVLQSDQRTRRAFFPEDEGADCLTFLNRSAWLWTNSVYFSFSLV